jgi:hypothetical protein
MTWSSRCQEYIDATQTFRQLGFRFGNQGQAAQLCFDRVSKIGFEGARLPAVPRSLYIFRQGAKTSNRTFARASEAGEPISSPQRKLWVRYQPSALSPRRGDISKHESDLQSHLFTHSACSAKGHARLLIPDLKPELHKFNYQEEFLALLQKHGGEYDERYIWH